VTSSRSDLVERLDQGNHVVADAVAEVAGLRLRHQILKVGRRQENQRVSPAAAVPRQNLPSGGLSEFHIGVAVQDAGEHGGGQGTKPACGPDVRREWEFRGIEFDGQVQERLESFD
jgi:hypothetical protein